MAVNSQRISTIVQAQARRINLGRYLRLDLSRYLLGLLLILCLMSLIVLVQTGVVATRGYAISALEVQKTELLRERALLQVRQARAMSLERIRRRAEEIGMRSITPDQVRYVVVPELHEPAAPPVLPAAAEDRAVLEPASWPDGPLEAEGQQ